MNELAFNSLTEIQHEQFFKTFQAESKRAWLAIAPTAPGKTTLIRMLARLLPRDSGNLVQ
jgi:energy-coupling factor transporter ATP-binding protein EcfA2